jgi:hypothetical protein
MDKMLEQKLMQATQAAEEQVILFKKKIEQSIVYVFNLG